MKLRRIEGVAAGGHGLRIGPSGIDAHSRKVLGSPRNSTKAKPTVEVRKAAASLLIENLRLSRCQARARDPGPPSRQRLLPERVSKPEEIREIHDSIPRQIKPGGVSRNLLPEDIGELKEVREVDDAVAGEI